MGVLCCLFSPMVLNRWGPPPNHIAYHKTVKFLEIHLKKQLTGKTKPKKKQTGISQPVTYTTDK